MFIKRFLEWIQLKKKLDTKKYKPPFVSEGDIWWASIGENVGAEISGKSHTFSRPVIILKKLSKELYLIVPATTQMKSGNWFIKFRERGNLEAIACLHQIRVIDYRRLFSRLAILDRSEFKKIMIGFINLYMPKQT